MKILTIIGARPQFVKAATVSREISKYSNIKEIIVHTGQHFDENMSDIFFEQMSIPAPDYYLDIAGLSHGAMTGRMLEKIEEILIKETPDWVVVYGDTNSTLAGALAASKLHISVAHVEAGLRSYNMKMPEEVNRVLTDRVSSLLLCPTDAAVRNLAAEGYEALGASIENCGDVMQDAAQFYSSKELKPSGDVPPIFDAEFVLATLHRAENTDSDERLTNIVDAINSIHDDTPVILPLHPRTKSKISLLGLDLKCHVIEPVGYLEMIYMLKRCKLVLTDSGGLQKEAFFFKKPCVTMRDETEWVELITSGSNILAGSDVMSILESFGKMKNRDIKDDDSLYGGGYAAKNIILSLLEHS